MSGIVGLWNLDGGPVDPAVLSRMSSAIGHRGPDGEGRRTERGVGFACQHLWVTAEEIGEVQPLVGRSGIMLVMDGRIDNRDELRRLLDGEGPLPSRGDPDLVLTAYRKWGPALADRILGDFALAVWDGERRRLVCARDAMGIRPLYYRRTRGELRAASQIGQLLAPGESMPELCEEFFAHYLITGVPHLELTPFQEIRCLPAGHALIQEAEGEPEIRRFWCPETLPEIRHARPQDYAEEFLSLFQQAVRCVLSDSQPAVFELSGGLDSSSIVAVAHLLAAHASPAAEFSTLSLVFDQATHSDERAFIAPMVERLGLRSRFLVADAWNVFEGAQQGAHYWDVPHTQICFFPTFRRYRQVMADERSRLLVSGIGAESVVGTEIPFPIHLSSSLRRLRLVRLARELAAWQRYRGVPLLNLFLDNCVKPLLRPGMQLYTRPERPPGWIARSFAKRHRLAERVNRGWMPLRFSDAADQLQYEHLGQNPSFRYQGYLERWGDIRYPFLYRPLVEFMLGIPREQKIRPGEFKPLLRRALAGILPEEIRTRQTKSGSGHWIYLSILRERPRLEPLLRRPLQAELGWVDGDELFKAFQLASHGHAPDSFMLTSALALELWLRAALGEPGAAAEPATAGEDRARAARA